MTLRALIRASSEGDASVDRGHGAFVSAQTLCDPGELMLPAAGSSVFGEPEAAAIADALFDAGLDGTFTDDRDPADEPAAAALVSRLAERFAMLPGAVRQSLHSAGAKADQLSGDRLQGLAEVIQNADDVAATEVRFWISDDDGQAALYAAHNGTRVRLHDVLALATPWLSSKAHNADATGRFGIGLMTLQSLAPTRELHSEPYRLRLGANTLEPVQGRDFPEALGDGAWTHLYIPLSAATLSIADVATWLGGWDHPSMLFLRSVRKISLVDDDGSDLVTLSLAVERERTLPQQDGAVVHRRLLAPDGRAWDVYVAEAEAPVHSRRAHKTTGDTTPVGVAFPVGHEELGWIYAGLPIRRIGLPMRLSAQFDPLASRQDLAETSWNCDLIPLLSELWLTAVLDVFARAPRSGWAATPLQAELDGDVLTKGRLRQTLDIRLLVEARRALSQQLRFSAGSETLTLDRLAVEHPALTDVLDPADVAAIAGRDAALPVQVRDLAERWRQVLADFEEIEEAAHPRVVTVRDALHLVEDEDREPEFTARLVSAGLIANEGEWLRALRCVVTADAAHVAPPLATSAAVLVTGAVEPLARELGLAVAVAQRYVDASTRPIQWLKSLRVLLDEPPLSELLSRLAASGERGTSTGVVLDDDQLIALRDAFERLAPGDRARLGPGVGRAIKVAVTVVNPDGQRFTRFAAPSEAYIVEREPDSWGVAAGQTPGLLWLHRRYSDVLKSPIGRDGLGAQKFFRLLGAESAPRPRPHPRGHERYANRALGVKIDVTGSPPARRRRLKQLSAEWTINDFDCPDLEAVLDNIATDTSERRRHRRTAAVLASLSRAWERLSEYATVTAAATNYDWRPQGTVPAWWVFQAADRAWLPDATGVLRPPQELRLRTAGNTAVYGPEPERYLDLRLDQLNRRIVLETFRVAGDPPASELLEALRHLRSATDMDDDERAARASVIYDVLASQIPPGAAPRTVGDVPAAQLRTTFALPPGLLLTSDGWRTPSAVLIGPSVFGALRTFVPASPNAERLWNLLGLRPPDANDCVAVLRELGRARRPLDDGEQLIMLETLRLLAQTIAALSAPPRWQKQVLLTSTGWTSQRPVYAVDDPGLAEALREVLPVWTPGGDLAQFRALLQPFDITQLDPASTEVIDAEDTEELPDETYLLHQAVRLLQADLARNDPDAEASGSIRWEDLARFEVRLQSPLRVRVCGTHVEPAPIVKLSAHLDRENGVLHVSDPELVGRVDGGGGAIAAAFNVDRRRLAYAWRVAWDEAEAGHRAEIIKLAARKEQEEKAARAAQQDERLRALQRELQEKHARAAKRQSPGKGEPIDSPTQSSADKPSADESPKPPARQLIDVSVVTLLNPEGEIVTPPEAPHPSEQTNSGTQRGAGGAASGSGRPAPLRDPDLSKKPKPPGSRRGPAGYTPVDKETVGLNLVRAALASDDERMVDIRNQHGVGADAVDELRRFFELKVHAGEEPDMIRLTDSEVGRALTDPQFFVAVVSNVEAGAGTPTVKIITDPVHTLIPTDTGVVELAGVRAARGLTYRFAIAERQTSDSASSDDT